MIKVTLNLGGLEYCEHYVRGENRIVGGESESTTYTYDGAIDHLFMLHDDLRHAIFKIDNPATLDGTYGAYIDGTYYDTIYAASDGTIYGVYYGGVDVLTEDEVLSADFFYERYGNIIADRSEVVICGTKAI
jgi:hypothetical protein